MNRKGVVLALAAVLVCSGLLLARTTQDRAKSAGQSTANAAAKLQARGAVTPAIPRNAVLPEVGEKPKTENLEGEFNHLSDEEVAKLLAIQEDAVEHEAQFADGQQSFEKQAGFDCATATVLTLAQMQGAGYTDSGVLGTTDACPNRPYFSVWYQYVCECSGAYWLNMCNSTGDTYIKVWSGPNCCTTLVGTADDECGGSDPNKSFTLTAGTTYWFECGYYSSTGGSGVTYNFGAKTACSNAVGACCVPSTGACTEGTAGDCAAAFGIYQGDGTTCTPNPCPQPCVLTCPPEGVAEPETCGTNANGGCNSSPRAYTTITPPQTICGTAWATGATRDTDWYELVLTQASTITVTLQSEFPSVVYILDANCPPVTTHASAVDGTCTTTTASACVFAGTYHIFVGTGDPNAIYNGWPCGTSNDYVMTVATEPCFPPYCAAGTTVTTCDEYIARVQVGTIDNATGCAAGGYNDFTALATQMIIGSSHAITITNGKPTYTTDQCATWVDWNQDHYFDPVTEKVALSGTPGGGPYTGMVTVPVTALPGATRMRVRINYNAAPPPCGNTTYGEVEDYTIDVKEAPPIGACCTGTSCTITDEETCLATPGNVYKGDGSTCTPNPCAGACCFLDGSCNDTYNQAGCEAAAGTYQGDMTDCDPNPCPQPGDACGNPKLITIGPGFGTYVDVDYTCGRLNDYADTCLGYYDGGEDMLYKITVTGDVYLTITLDPNGTTYPGFALASTCPPGATGCIIVKTQSASTPMSSACTFLTAGEYYLMIDTWPSPNCIPYFTMTLTECTPAIGRCCYAPWPNCIDSITQGDCTTLYSGTWTQDLTCAANPCPLTLTPGETCAQAYVIPSVPFAAEYNTDTATADGPSCNPSYTLMQNDVWLSYTPTQDCLLTLDVSDITSYDMVMAIFSGPDCNTLTQLYCVDDPEPYHIQFVATAGTTYWFQQGDYGSTEGGGQTSFALSCSSAIGACCFGDGHCESLSAVACMAAAGTFEGEGIACDPNPCPQPQPGDTCELPIAVNLPAQLPYTDPAQYTCGRPGRDPNSCLGSYDSGPYIIYKLYVAEDMCIDITAVGADPNNDYIGIAVDAACPAGPTCIAAAGNSSTTVSITALVLPAGTYTLMVSNWAPAPDCLYNFTLTIATSTACPQGACCLSTPTPTCYVTWETSCAAAGGTFGGANTVCSGNDCNGNGVDDFCDILGGMADCNANGIPDACEIAADPNLDADLNGILDVCQPDCNGNGVPDTCELPGGCATGNCGTVYPAACGLLLDCQPNGIPDVCELVGGAGTVYQVDDGTHENSIGLTDGGKIAWMNHFTVVTDGSPIISISLAWGDVPNGTPCTVYVWSDPDGNGNPTDARVIASADTVVANADTDTFTTVTIPAAAVGPVGTSFFAGAMITHIADQFPASLDQNSTLNGQSWIAGDTTGTLDPNNLGGGDVAPVNIDTISGLEGNWLVRATAQAASGDCNGNGIPDDCDVRDHPEWDCDGNGVIDTCEWADCNGNGILDACDILSGYSTDCQPNGIPDECDITSGTSLDCNLNTIPDECDLASGHSPDCNLNGIPDECDIASGYSEDCQPNQVPDECELGRDRAIVISEGFESTVPPATWTAIVTIPGYTWFADANGTPPEGAQFADCLYDPQLRTQDEWLITPSLNMNGQVTLTGQSMGSVYWGITPYDNYDIEAWVVIGPNVNDGDDILIGQIDEDTWATNWVWVGFSYQFTAPSTAFRIGLRYHGADGAQAGLDAIVVDGQAGPPANDCNLNGVPDECDIASGYSHDYNHNGTPDECEPLCGDLNGDSQVNVADYYLLRAAMGHCAPDPAYLAAADFDSDGCVTLVDYQSWLVCYHMANGKDFVVPKKPPVRIDVPVPARTPENSQQAVVR